MGERASVSRGKVCAPSAASFALMSVGARHARHAPGERAARACRRRRRAREPRMERREREKAPGPWSSRALTHMRRRRKRQLQPRALRRGPLGTPFYRFASPSPPFFTPSLCTLFPSFSLSLSLYRASPNSVVLFRLLSTLLSFFLSFSLFLPRADVRAPCVSPFSFSCTVTRTHACTYAHRGWVVRQRGPPDSSPAA